MRLCIPQCLGTMKMNPCIAAPTEQPSLILRVNVCVYSLLFHAKRWKVSVSIAEVLDLAGNVQDLFLTLVVSCLRW